MRDWVSFAAGRFGQELVIRSGNAVERRVWAFLQPVFRDGETLPDDFTPAGWTDRRLWRYIGPEPLEEGDQVLGLGFAFRVLSCRQALFGNASCYWRAALEREKEEAFEGTSADPQRGD